MPGGIPKYKTTQPNPTYYLTRWSNVYMTFQKVTVMVSNAPPHQLCQFLKAAAAKLAGGRGAPALTARKKLLSGLPQSLDGISPVTQKDVKGCNSIATLKTGLASNWATFRAKFSARALQI